MPRDLVALSAHGLIDDRVSVCEMENRPPLQAVLQTAEGAASAWASTQTPLSAGGCSENGLLIAVCTASKKTDWLQANGQLGKLVILFVFRLL